MTESSVDAMETIAGDASRPVGERDDGLAKGTLLGRYVVLGPAGAGSMGVVYAAIDPELDRKLAVKLLHRRSRGSTESMRVRLLNEAKILARLAHPNVVAIHDVGTFEQHVWLAMEFIEGDTLRMWSAAARRNWREVLDVMIPAGRGLVAAHDAGLVHRDFKPENVMVGADGRVRVTDFGLAGTPGSAAVSEPAEASGEHSASTMDRGPVGTPAYMAPEQISAHTHGPAADQFAFCVTLWEALCGARPFGGDNTASIVTAVLEHRLRPPTDRGAMPSWLRRVLLRGLALDPSARFPSMAALLDALERSQKRRRIASIAAAIAVAMAIPVAVWAVRGNEHRRLLRACAEQGATIASTWPGPEQSVRDGVVAGLRGVGPNGDAIAERLTPWLDASASRWAEVREQTCRAHAIDREWDDDLLARADACLEEQRISLEALLQALARADAQVVYRSVSLAAGLPLADACADARELERMPPGGAHVEMIGLLRALEARGSTLRAAGEYPASMFLADHQLAIAEHIDSPIERVKALVVRGQALIARARYEEAEAAFTDAYARAGRLGAMRPAAVAANELISIVGERRGRPAEGLVWAHAAEFATADLEQTPGLLTAVRLQHVARLHDDRGHYDEAVAAATESLAIFEDALGPEHPSAVNQLGEIGGIYMRAGRLPEAEAVLARVLPLAERVLGSEHPDVVSCLTHIGNVNVALGRWREAERFYERSLAILERVHGPRDPAIAGTLMNLANARRQAGDLEGLEPLFERAISIQEELQGEGHPNLAITLTNYGAWLMDAGEPARAKEVFTRAVAIETASGAAERPQLAATLHNLALIHTDLGELDEAARLSERALAILNRTVDRDHPMRASILIGLSEIEQRSGHVDKAVAIAEEALGIRERAGVGRRDVAVAEFTLARAIWDRKEERARALELAERARTTFVAEHADPELEHLTKWLAEHPR